MFGGDRRSEIFPHILTALAARLCAALLTGGEALNYRAGGLVNLM